MLYSYPLARSCPLTRDLSGSSLSEYATFVRAREKVCRMNASRPIINRIKNSFNRPIVLGPLAFLAGGFWVQTILDNFNSQKCHSSLFRGLIYEMQLNDKTKSLLGEGIEYDEKKQPRVKGHIDNLKGHCDLEFMVQGSKGDAVVKFVGVRYRDTDCWVSSTFSITKDHQQINL